tara:strand:+ start:749 stop:1027 length:279 start_codon:yes stop_codon:yes gene_type:complete
MNFKYQRSNEEKMFVRVKFDSQQNFIGTGVVDSVGIEVTSSSTAVNPLHSVLVKVKSVDGILGHAVDVSMHCDLIIIFCEVDVSPDTRALTV